MSKKVHRVKMILRGAEELISTGGRSMLDFKRIKGQENLRISSRSMPSRWILS